MKVILLTVVIFFIGCSVNTDPIGPSIKQHASHVINYSSQYTSSSWSAAKALGEPNVYPLYGDETEAWASRTADNSREFLELGFDTAQTVRIIEIYETWYPGAIDTVYLRNEKTQAWKRVYSRPAFPLGGDTARIFTIYFKETEFLADAIRLAINSPIDSLLKESPDDFVYGWNEIDAVAISGFRKEVE